MARVVLPHGTHFKLIQAISDADGNSVVDFCAKFETETDAIEACDAYDGKKHTNTYICFRKVDPRIIPELCASYAVKSLH